MKNTVTNGKFALEVEGYSKNFGKFQATKNVSFKVKHGVIHGFIGPNGAGKTTTIKAIIGAYFTNKGKILIEGFKAGSVDAKKAIGYIPERASFPKELTCLDYLISMAQLSGFPAKVAKQKANETLTKLGLIKHKWRNPNDFSSGMKKKILLAQALILNPSVLILDEPAANLDPTARKEMFNDFIKLKNQGIAIFISSHILLELQSIVDYVTFISDGEIRYSGKVDNLSAKHGIIVVFKDENDPKTQNLIKKNQFTKTINGWMVKTNNEEDTQKIIKKIISDKISFSNISMLENNLTVAYDNLVIANQGKNNSGEQK